MMKRTHFSKIKFFLIGFLLIIFSPLGALAQYGRGGTNGGGGSSDTGQYSGVMIRAIRELNQICQSLPTVSIDQELCQIVPRMSAKAESLKIEPNARDTIIGIDGKPRDAGNDGVNTVYLDIDRWGDKIQEKDPAKIVAVRRGMLVLALHEPAILIGAEKNDNYSASNPLVDLLERHHIDIHMLAGLPPPKAVEMEEYSFRGEQIFNLKNTPRRELQIKLCRAESAMQAAYASAVEGANAFGFSQCQEEISRRGADANMEVEDAYKRIRCITFAKCKRPKRSSGKVTAPNASSPAF